MKKDEKQHMTLANPSHRIVSGLVLCALGIFLTNFAMERNLQLIGRDFAMFIVITFFYTTAIYCLFSWSKTSFTRNSLRFRQETYHFGCIKKVREGECSTVFFHQTPQLRPSYTLFLSVKGEDDLIVREGLKKSEARKIGNKIAEICGLTPIPEEPKKEVKKGFDEFVKEMDEDDLED